MLFESIRTYGRLIKFSHTVFALPFALAAVVLAHRQQPVTWSTLGCIVLAMAAARSAAMGFNRVADYEYDRRNPRTCDRPLSCGQIDKRSVLIFVAVSSSVFVMSAALLGRLCMILSVPVLFVLFFYSLTKRFTAFSHLFLGLAIGLAPAGAWVAITGTLDTRIILLSLALMTYIAGFDILYACQDVEFDCREKLFSIPARWGIRRAFQVSLVLHLVCFLSLLSLYFAFDLGAVYLGFLSVILMLLVLEHRLVRPEDLQKIDLAFFHVNSAISMLLFLAVLADTWFSS
jgi:4-hydroxybenzoate polyprenyltransferase